MTAPTRINAPFSLRLPALAALVLGFCGSLPMASANPACGAVEPELSPSRWLRAVSLDLRGVIPSVGETQDVLNAADPHAAVVEQIDAWLLQDAFTERAVRFHRAILWPNLDNVNLGRAASSLRQDSAIFWRLGQASTFRGKAVQCLNEPAEFTNTGAIVAKPQADGSVKEGWVWVNPYWAPQNPIRVCAFDAQESLISPAGIACNTNAGQTLSACGCGPNLAFCRFGNTHLDVVRSFVHDIELRIRRVIGQGRSYLELFTDRVGYVNGPIAHYYKWQAGIHSGVRMLPLAVDAASIPDLPHTAKDVWQEVVFPESHAGILSSPAYLLRFQTNRARANQFYNGFLCQPFQPPDTGIDATDNTAALQVDLQEREGCKWCHTTLEPAAAFWARWTEVGGGYLDPNIYPAVRADCLLCATTNAPCSDDCKRYYLTQPMAAEELPYLGHLQGYVFRHPQHHANVELGPGMLALTKTVSDHLPLCMARQVANWLLRRPLDIGEEWFAEELAVVFAASGFDFRALVRHAVTSPLYRRVQ